MPIPTHETRYPASKKRDVHSWLVGVNFFHEGVLVSILVVLFQWFCFKARECICVNVSVIPLVQYLNQMFQGT